MKIFEIAATIFVAAWQFLNCLKKFYLPILFMQKAVQWYFFFPKNIEILRFLQEKAGLQGNKRKRKKPEKALCWPFSTFQLGRKCILNLFNPIFSRLTCGLLNQTCLSCRDDIGYISYQAMVQGLSMTNKVLVTIKAWPIAQFLISDLVITIGDCFLAITKGDHNCKNWRLRSLW